MFYVFASNHSECSLGYLLCFKSFMIHMFSTVVWYVVNFNIDFVNIILNSDVLTLVGRSNAYSFFKIFSEIKI
jgi:hypothetical protein